MKNTKIHKCEYPECSGKPLSELNGYTLCGYFEMERRVFISYKDARKIKGSIGTS